MGFPARFGGVLSFVAFLAAVAPAARGEEAATEVAVDEVLARVDALEDSVAQHRKEEDAAALGSDLDAIVAAHAATTDEKLRGRLNGLLGDVLKSADDEDLERQALAAIGKTGDEENWKHVRSYVRQPNDEKVPPLLEAAIQCVAQIRPDAAVGPLLRIVEDSKVYSVAATAMEALGHYGDRERVRERILEALVKTVRKNVPGGPTRGKSDPHRGGYIPPKNATGDSSRWGTLAPALVKSLNRLTGQSAPTAQDWFDLYDRYKNDLESLFDRR
jgi:hypothetical protein